MRFEAEMTVAGSSYDQCVDMARKHFDALFDGADYDLRVEVSAVQKLTLDVVTWTGKAYAERMAG